MKSLMPYRQVSRLPNYIRAFGFSAGTRLNVMVESLGSDPNRRRRIRVPGYPRAIELRDAVGDRSIFWQCLVMRQYDTRSFPHHRALERAYRRRLANGRKPIIVDGGGNIGLSAAWFATQYPEAHIVTVEPDAKNFQILEINTASFGDRVTRLQGALWRSNARLAIANPDAGSTAFRVEEDGNGPVQGWSMENIVSNAGGDGDIMIAKLDIEGSQKYLFGSNTDWIGKTDLLAIELDDWQYPWEGTSDTFIRAMAHHKFEYLVSGETLFCFNSRLAERP